MHCDIQAADEIHRLKVFIATVLIRQPLTFLTRIVQIKHRGHGINPQRIDMELIDPVQSAADQIVDDLTPSIIENQSTPVSVLTFAGILMFIQGRAVKATEPVGIFREMRRYPIDNDADTCQMTLIDKIAEVIRVAKALCRRIHADRLISPGTVERMLRDR